MEVPTLAEHNALKAVVEHLQRQMAIIYEQLPTMLTIEQTAATLNCSRMTLHRLKLRGDLLPMRYEGKKPLYHVYDIRRYMLSTCISEETASQRLLIAQTSGAVASHQGRA